MARQTGKVKLEGRVGNVIYYKMNGKHYARSMSSLTGKRVKRDPRFKRTMEFARILGVASKIASGIHRSLPFRKRNVKLYRKITGQANQFLKNGMDSITVEERLKRLYLSEHHLVNTAVCSPESNKVQLALLKPTPSLRPAGKRILMENLALIPAQTATLMKGISSWAYHMIEGNVNYLPELYEQYLEISLMDGVVQDS